MYLSIKQVASELNVSEKTAGKIKKDISGNKCLTVPAFCEYLGISIKDYYEVKKYRQK